MWWDNLSNFQQITFIVAVTSTFIMLVFLILMLIGVEGTDFDGGVDADVDMDGFNDEPLSGIGGLKILTFRSFLVLLSIGGWIAYLFDPMTGSIWASVIGIVIGALSAVLVALAYRSMMKLESAGNIDYHNAIGKIAVVYLRVPKEKKGTGKVTLTVQGRYLEVDAITHDKEDILVNKFVEVVGLENDNTLIVKERKEENKDA